MALAKERSISQDAHLGSSQSYTHFGSTYGGPSIQVSDPSLGMFAIESNHRLALEERDGLEEAVVSSKNLTTNNTSLSDLHNTEVPGGFMLGAINSLPPLVEAQSLLNFKTGPDHWDYSSGSLLSFEQGDQLSHAVYPKNGHEDDYSLWENAVDHSEEFNQSNLKCGSEACLVDDVNCCEATGGCGQINSAHKDGQHGEVQPGWLYSGAIAGDGFQGSGVFDECHNKRPYQGDHDIQALKKHCSSPPKKAKPKPVPSKDPQSIAAKNRRERISERLKILQDLVPNGAKVDMVTMLEKAISYVKFLQLQVKVLATDEFWPAQGGKAPEISQVKEAIDAILSSHRETSAISSK